MEEIKSVGLKMVRVNGRREPVMKVWLELENYRFILTSLLGRSGIQKNWPGWQKNGPQKYPGPNPWDL